MKPTLVLLPGMDGTGDLFAALLAVLDAAVPTVVVRYPDESLDYAAHERLAPAARPRINATSSSMSRSRDRLQFP